MRTVPAYGLAVDYNTDQKPLALSEIHAYNIWVIK